MVFITDEVSSLQQFKKAVRDLNQDEKVLIRFLTARNYRIDDAEQMLRYAVAWRKEIGLDNYHLKKWKFPPHFYSNITYRFHGEDYEGSPISWVFIGTWAFKHMLENEDVEQIQRYCYAMMEEGLQKTIEYGSQGHMVIDLEGLTYTQATHIPSLKFAYFAFKKMEQCFPEVLKSVYIINAPWIFSFAYNFLKGVVAEGTMAKMKIFSYKEDWHAEFLKRFPRETTCDDRTEKINKYILESGYSHQENPLLIELVKKSIIPPSTKPYNVTKWSAKKGLPSNVEKLKMVEYLLIKKSFTKPGFFVECGANDGEFISPTLSLEQTYNWTGLLIEANPEPFSKLEARNRKAWLINTAVCTTPFAKKIPFFINPNNSGVSGLNKRKGYGVIVPLSIQCIPLYTILAALNITEVDYFSLDVEGLELEILRTVPFDKVMFKFLTIEHWSIPGGRKVLQAFMESKGYLFIKEINDTLTKDSAFIHKSFRHKLKGGKIIVDIYDFDKEHEKLSKYILESGHSHQDNPLLIELTRKLLIPPSTKPSNVTKWTVNKAIPTNREKLKMMEALLIDKSKPGFYIECGANDGEFISPTLPLEQTYNWTGLLIEANPEPFSILETRNRKAWLMNAAVCTTPFAKQVTFYTNPKMTGLAGLNERKHKGVSVSLTVQCIPLYTILTALNITQVDYLSLDVEGLELEILKTVPFDKIMFKFLTIEHWSIPGGRKALQTFMESKGYVFIKELNDKHTRDSAFIHHSLRHKLNIEKGI
ncbi:unnamed protein product [Orchesella dallaii]|uniref:CRAL-TRIO domain-containing protein n=1 Tax=Orchesella dallaii TaxID=48710 RepID=A0ABP1S751_9HEXA